MKKIMYFVLLGMVIIFYSACSGGGGESAPAQSSQKAITEFSLDGFDGGINEETKTITVTVPYGTSLNDMVATFATTGAKVEVEGTEQMSGFTANDFTSQVIYAVIAEDKSTQDYRVIVVWEEREPATAISAAMTPDNSGTSVAIGVYCTRTKSISGSQTVIPDDDRTIISWEFLYNGSVVKSGSATLGELKKTPARINAPFASGAIITYKATADDAVSDSTSAKVACGG